MKVKIFDEDHEKDLETSINEFLSELEGTVVDIKYQVTIGISGEEQIYCFSAMVIYKK
ncbi:MAG: sporulation protein Cse60 [Bacilli bacterium]|nr:sporulation protein Cse60 [Bacilli bacterium]MDD4718439.1 sporulation protein Cse60 [Bacilli bacterium]